jgi:hypothetical protein
VTHKKKKNTTRSVRGVGLLVVKAWDAGEGVRRQWSSSEERRWKDGVLLFYHTHYAGKAETGEAEGAREREGERERERQRQRGVCVEE